MECLKVTTEIKWIKKKTVKREDKSIGQCYDDFIFCKIKVTLSFIIIGLVGKI